MLIVPKVNLGPNTYSCPFTWALMLTILLTVNTEPKGVPNLDCDLHATMNHDPNSDFEPDTEPDHDHNLDTYAKADINPGPDLDADPDSRYLTHDFTH